MTARKAREVKLSLDEVGRSGSVVVDGQDVSGLTRSVSVVAAVGEPTKVRLGLARVVLSGDLQAQVEVDAPTRDFLLTLGWTPPAVD